MGEFLSLDVESIALHSGVPHASFGDFAMKTETGGDEESAWLDIVLYHDEEREISFCALKEAALFLGLRMQPACRVVSALAGRFDYRGCDQAQPQGLRAPMMASPKSCQ